MNEDLLPSYCPEHRDAPILHDWRRTQYSISGGDMGMSLDGDHHYYCAVCHLEVCSPEEYERRQAKLENEHDK